MSDGPLSIRVNGRAVPAPSVPDSERLLDTVRWRFGLRGTKEGCRSGGCGACMVLVDGQATLSCLTLSREVDGAEIVTIEGIEEDPVGRAVLSAFRNAEALQCGYCTPGFVVALTGLLKEHGTSRSTPQLLEELGGNLCRCTGYAAIARAVGIAREHLP